ncbi:uncharacterized protein F5147DRAFT_656615 [Suillus discolor]|uniref:Uncharacterized protein n=1 Tax=Suillus discolor TaxID=1912936 RepID=A0A9P7EXI5_9AGAM|nr:uncharacterized protein F5147DRAFT_656615 [Suillus discolor]KAG2096297.1 hypothetical protein F5147DRAFT_656615 [Suillus discolor]
MTSISVTATSGPLTRALISQQVYHSGGSGTFWAVDDAVAKLIIKAFYENVFKDSKNGSAMDCTKVAWAHAACEDESAAQTEDGFHSYRCVVPRRIPVVRNDPDLDTVCPSYLIFCNSESSVLDDLHVLCIPWRLSFRKFRSVTTPPKNSSL